MNRTAPLKHREFLPRDWTPQDTIALSTLPRGWRWLKIGERTMKGDMTHDPRCAPVEMIGSESWCITELTHPVRRRIK